MSALTVASAAGVGLVLELMQYWQDWIEGYGFSKEDAKLITAQTFLGGASLSLENQNLSFDEIINQIASKKGVTESGLNSMRETDIDRVLRISFEKAYMRDRELGK
jgi:pyrroline-5-carboxylate reductase